MNAAMSEEWFALPTTKVCGDDVSVRIRAWVPGDGLACRGAGAKRVPCGAPVAVMRSTKDFRGRVRSSTSVYCGRHVAEIVRRQLGEADWRGTPSSVRTIRKAEETVLAAHWDEYQETLNQLVSEERERYLSVLPEWLREGFDAAEAVA